MIKVGVTGRNGFIGKHVSNTLRLHPEEFEEVDFERNFFDDSELLNAFVNACDVIIHLAALNRHEDDVFLHDKNISLAQTLVEACENTGAKPKLIFSSSVQENRDNFYGMSKKKGSDLIKAWSEKSGATYAIMVIPNVFGPFGKPYYNSVISTFCFELLNNKAPKILADNYVEFIYVDELVEKILEAARNTTLSTYAEVAPTCGSNVSEILSTLEEYKKQYIGNNTIPALPDAFHLNLFNTFRSFIDHGSYFPVSLKQHIDERGAFTEIIRLGIGGQVSFSTTHGGIVRGNHFHRRKIERFAVIKGEALIQTRKLGEEEVLEFTLDGETPAYVDMPIWYTHNIQNTGTETLFTIFWINEPYDADNPDTYFEKV